jgi:coenzyme F420 biosynthesis associated uncharacterized protein
MTKIRGRWLGWGFLIGAAAGLVYTWRRAQEVAEEGPPTLLDWERVLTVANRFYTEGNVAPGQEAKFADMVNRSVKEVSRYTGMEIPSSALQIRVLNRRQWLETNIDAFQTVLRPLEELYERASSKRNLLTLFLGNPLQALLSHQVGLMLGYLAQRVLGQYDVALLGREPLQDGQLYFVDPNIRSTQYQLGLTGSDFSMWIALHETTHAFEFEAHPWLRDHFNYLLKQYLADLEPEIEHLSQQLSPDGLADLMERIRQGESWLLWALTPRQRELFDQMQALMCIVEGYSNHVMRQVGQQILPSFDLIEARVAARQQQRSSAQRLLARLTGLDLKMEQYRLGEQFAEIVVEQRGLSFLQKVWQGPEALPTLEEISHPASWIARMEG